MKLRIWLYDLAREQSPTLEHLRRLLRTTIDGGYNAIGLYLEHRFAYPSAAFAAGRGALTPAMIFTLESEFPEIQIVPFINLLGHFEGMIYCEEGAPFAEERFKGMQACPCKPEFVRFAEKLIDDTIHAFKSPVIHIGGDETWQLGICDACKEKVEDWSRSGDAVDGKAMLYGNHFGPLAQRVIDAGRRPAVWGDMFFDHPQALNLIPQSTLIFDWQYFQSAAATSQKFIDSGFEVVPSPTLHTYNASWLHLPQSEQNVRDAVAAQRKIGAHGVCVTTWECGLFGNYETMLPAIEAAGQLLIDDSILPSSPPQLNPADAISASASIREAPAFLKSYLREGETYEEWARLMGVELQSLGGCFAFTGTRSSLKVRLLLNSNPFLAWLYHADELSGPIGDAALEIAERALVMAPNVSARGVAQFLKSSIQFVRFAEQAHQAYAERKPGAAITMLSPARQVFEDLLKIARATNINIGGSLADIERCHVAKEHVERVIRRIKLYGDGSLGYLPSFSMITHLKFVPHDQAGWWLINRWANE